MIHSSPHRPVALTGAPLHHDVRRGLTSRGDQVAVTDLGSARAFSGSAMVRWIDAEGGRLRRAGLHPHDVVGIAGPGGAAWLASAFGALAAGLTVLPLNPLAPPQLASSALDRAGARAVIVARGDPDWAAAAAGSDRTVLTLIPEPTEPADARRFEPVDATGDTDAFLLSSSGTTGLPKLVRVTHRVLGATVQLVPPAIRFGPEDSMLVALPLFHAGGLTVATIPLAIGAHLVIQPGFEPEGFVSAIETHRVTAAIVVPPICHSLLTHAAVDHHDLSSLRFIHSTAAPLPDSIQRALSARLDCHVGQGLGLTEALPISLSDPTRPAVSGSSGRAVPNTELRLVDPDTDRDVSDPADAGELWVRGPQVMAGYLDDPDATAAALTPDGWLRTGDLCRIDDDGNVFVVGRLKELIKVSGYQVAPASLEAMIGDYPGVIDCAVVGRPDLRRGEVPVAFVVASGPVDHAALIDRTASQTAPYARLAEVILIDAIPRNPAGKVLRRSLRDLLDTTTAAI